MRWVTYLSPSGGGKRVGALDDGDVLGYPGPESLGELLDAGYHAMDNALQTCLRAASEIIVEPEARMCAPVDPAALVPVRVGDRELEIHPELVRGVDDAVLPEARTACVGVAALTTADVRAVAYTPACLWLDEEERPVQLTLGPVLTFDEGRGMRPIELSTSVDDLENGRGLVDPAHQWLASGPGRMRALLPVITPALAEDDELLVDAGELGTYEVRVGSQV